MLAWSHSRTVWHIPSFTDTIEKAKEASPGISPTIPSASHLINMLLPRVLGNREWGEVAAHGPGPDAGMCRLVTRPFPVWHPCDQHLHAHDTPLDLIYFFPPLGLQSKYLALKRLAASRQIGRRSLMGIELMVPTGRKKKTQINMWVQGDFLTIYRIRGIVYFLHISQRVHLWAPFTTSNRQVGRPMAVKIRWWLINGLATGFNTQIHKDFYFFP